MSDSYSFSLQYTGDAVVNGKRGKCFNLIADETTYNKALVEFYNEFLKNSLKKHTHLGYFYAVYQLEKSKFCFLFDTELYLAQEKSEDYFEMVLDFNEIDATLKLSEKELNCFNAIIGDTK